MKQNYKIFIYFLVLLFISSSAFTSTYEHEDRIHITNLHHIDDDLYAFGQSVTIDGTIDGDLISGCYTISNNGKIGGSTNISAYKYIESGKVKGSVRTFSNTAHFSGYIGRSALLICSDVTIDRGAEIEKDAFIAGGTATIDGVINGDLTFYGGQIYISGEIGGDVIIEADKIFITSPAIIKGNLTYTSSKEAVISIDKGVIIEGETVWNLPDEKEGDKSSEIITSTVLNISKMLAALIFGIILLYLFRCYAESSLQQLQTRVGHSLAIGILTFFIVVFSAVILLLSLGGIMIGLIVASGDTAIIGAFLLVVSILLIPITSFVSVSGGILFYTGKILIALWIGYMIVKSSKSQALPMTKTQMLIGLIVITIFFSIPYIGSIIYIICGLIGMGAIVLGVKNCQTVQANSNNNSIQDKKDI